jgi:hypothetical protein
MRSFRQRRCFLLRELTGARVEPKAASEAPASNADDTENHSNFLRRVMADFQREADRCSRICNCQSTQKPQGSTGFGLYAVSISIKST